MNDWREREAIQNVLTLEAGNKRCLVRCESWTAAAVAARSSLMMMTLVVELAESGGVMQISAVEA